MNEKKSIDYKINIGTLKRGKLNKISDVSGVNVGHCTIDNANNKTGVTVIMPGENIFVENLIASSHVINGYGKSTGLIEIEELGILESPIALTNTLNVGLVHDGLVDYMIDRCERQSINLTTYNPIVCECNDSYLNDIKNRVIKKEHVYRAIENASIDFIEGDIGAGKGMSCYQLKGGIGSASRVIEIEGNEFILGGLVLSNFGELKDLTIDGHNIGIDIDKEIGSKKEKMEGSIIIILATDVPLSSRQIKRLCKRADLGLARTGSYISNGSGDIVIGFSTGNIISKNNKSSLNYMKILKESDMNKLFRAVVEVTEESVINSMVTANEVTGYKGNKRMSLKEFI